MTKPKAEIRKVTKNRFGHPQVSARSAIGSFVFDGKTYDQIHIVANAATGELTLRSTTSPYASRPQDVGCFFSSKAYDWQNHDEGTLIAFVNELIAAFKTGKIPNDIRLKPVVFGVLV